MSASIVGGKVVVRMPTHMTKAQEDEYVAALVARLERRRRSETVDLPTRAAALARKYDLPQPTSIRFVSNQASRWGSCTPSTGEIRVSDRIAGFPGWVLDAVVVHELAHLVHLHHTPEFWALAHRYPPHRAGPRIPHREAAHRRRGRPDPVVGEAAAQVACCGAASPGGSLGEKIVGQHRGADLAGPVGAVVEPLQRPLHRVELRLDPVERRQVRHPRRLDRLRLDGLGGKVGHVANGR